MYVCVVNGIYPRDPQSTNVFRLCVGKTTQQGSGNTRFWCTKKYSAPTVHAFYRYAWTKWFLSCSLMCVSHRHRQVITGRTYRFTEVRKSRFILEGTSKEPVGPRVYLAVTLRFTIHHSGGPFPQRWHHLPVNVPQQCRHLNAKTAFSSALNVMPHYDWLDYYFCFSKKTTDSKTQKSGPTKVADWQHVGAEKFTP